MATDSARMDARSTTVATTVPSLIALAQTEQVDRALRRVARNVATLINAGFAALAIYDAQTHELVLAQTIGTAGRLGPQRHIPLPRGIIGAAAAQNQIANIENLAHEAKWDVTDGPRAGSLLCVPLSEDGVLLGVLVATSERVHAFGPRHVTCVEALADAAVLILARARLTYAADCERRQLQTLVEAARAITTLHDPRAVFDNIAGGIQRIVTYDDAIIYAHDAAARDLQVVASKGERSAHLCAERVSLSDPHSISVRVAQTRQALLYTPDAAMDRPGRITEAFLAGEDLALLCVPLLSKDVLRGVVTLARKQPFQPEDVRAMSDLAPLVATALENVALYASVRAEQSSRMRILQLISHEIKSPLHTLNGYLDLALSGANSAADERQGMLLQRARASSERLSAQVRDLLLLAYEDAEEFPLQIVALDVRRVLQSAVEAVEIVAQEQGVQLHLVAPPNLPPLLADAERLGQVARNLLNNAIAHTPRGGHVTVEARAGLSAMEISVIDTGCGIAGEHHARLFERFYRVPAAPGMVQRSGQGLGLSIVKTIVERHGGRVQVQSAPGQGSRFTVTIPFQRAAPGQRPQA